MGTPNGSVHVPISSIRSLSWHPTMSRNRVGRPWPILRRVVRHGECHGRVVEFKHIDLDNFRGFGVPIRV